MIRFQILVCVVALAVFGGVVVVGDRMVRPGQQRPAPLSVRFIPESASKADGFACIPDPAAPRNEPGLMCVTLDHYELLRDRVELEESQTGGDL